MPERVRDLPLGPNSDTRLPRAWPIALVVVGLVWLVASLTGWRVFPTLASLLVVWPVVLIGVGVGILTAGRYRSRVLLLTLLGSLVWWWLAGGWGVGERAEVRIPLEGARRAPLSLQFAANDLLMDAAAPAGVLLQRSLELAPG